MTAPAHADRVAAALLRYVRDPVRFQAEMLRPDQVSANLDLLVRLALGRPVEFADPELHRPGIAQDLASAALYFVRHALFREGATHYEVLGLPTDASAAAIREHHRLLIQLVHPDRHHEGMTWPESVAARVNRAYSALKDRAARAAYDQSLADARGRRGAAAPRTRAIQVSAGRIARIRRPLRPPPLPEWFTAGVGGFVRRHTAFSIFGGLVSLCVLTVLSIVWSEREATLVRHVPQAAGGQIADPTALPVGAHPKSDTQSPQIARASAALAAGHEPVLGAAKPESKAVSVATTGRVTAERPPAPAWETHSSRRPEPAVAVRSSADTGTGSQPGERPAAGENRAPVAAPAAAMPVTAAAKEAARPQLAETPAVAPPAPPIPMPPAALPVHALAVAAAAPAKPATIASDTETPAADPPDAPTSAEVEVLIAAFISNYEGGRLDAFASLFDIDARTNERTGRAAIRSDYDELFQRSNWRRINLRHLVWQTVGERTEANGEIAVQIGWRDGREVEERIALEMELMHRGGRTVIARLSQRARN